MKATVVIDKIEYIESIAEYITNSIGIRNVVTNTSNTMLTFHFSTHNAIEGLREQLLDKGYAFEFIF